MNIPMLRDLSNKIDEIIFKYPDATIGELLAGLIAATLTAASQANEVELAGAMWDKTFDAVKNIGLPTLLKDKSESN